jgi:hypothetical protein
MGAGWTWLEWAILGIPLVATAFVLRVAVHAGREPGGVDAWYYLAWADAFRRLKDPEFRAVRAVVMLESAPPGVDPQRNYWLRNDAEYFVGRSVASPYYIAGD